MHLIRIPSETPISVAFCDAPLGATLFSSPLASVMSGPAAVVSPEVLNKSYDQASNKEGSTAIQSKGKQLKLQNPAVMDLPRGYTGE